MTPRLAGFVRKLTILITFPWTGSYVHPTAIVALPAGAQLALGRRTRVGRHSMLYLRPGATLGIGDNTVIGHYANLRPGGRMSIGCDVRIGQFVSVLGDNHRFDRTDVPIYQQGEEPHDVTIEDNVWVGAQAVILPGIRIGTGSVIGAGAIVTRDVPPFSVAVGNPARVIRSRECRESA
jgi:galactoside O-acetyltransferase